jgi:multiple sugar transport system substrate-binding protein
MRRIPVAGAVVGLAFALAACGGGSDTKDKGAAKPKTAAETLDGRGPFTFVTGKDLSGNLQRSLDEWNKAHPTEEAKLLELSDDPNQQRESMVNNFKTKSDAYGILNVDVVQTSEYAANQWLAKIPAKLVDSSLYLAPTLETTKYRGNFYAMPANTETGLLFYRKDLLAQAGITEVPKTYADLFKACDTIKSKVPAAKSMDCYAGQFKVSEGLTVNAAEAINSAGGVIIGADGKPNVNTPEAKAGIQMLVEAFKKGYIPQKALTFDEEAGRADFEAGKLIFHRQWAYQWGKSLEKGSTSKVKGKYEVAPLPGLTGPGQGTLGGHNLAISNYAKNKASALDFIKFFTGADQQKTQTIQSNGNAPGLASVFDDPELTSKYPYLPALKAGVLAAKPRPIVVNYGDVTKAIQDAIYPALTGAKTVDDALAGLQTKLETLTVQ